MRIDPQAPGPPRCNNDAVTHSSASEELPQHEDAFSRPPKRIPGDWSAHLATTLDRLADLLDELDESQWEAPSLCEGWRIRDVVGHLLWRLGEHSGTMLRSGVRAARRARLSPSRAISEIAVREGSAAPEELVSRLRAIGEEKLQGIGRTGIIELTEAVVHTYDITEALGLPIRLSPHSTGAVALAHVRSIARGKSARIVRRRSLRATDARWVIGQGSPVDATAGEIIMHLFGRRELRRPRD